MKKIWLIIKREYLTRVKKKSFIVMTFLGPVLMASVWIVPIILASKSEGVKTVEVLDETGIFLDRFKDTESIKFSYIFTDLQSAKEALSESKDYAILYIPKGEYAVPSTAYIYSYKKPGLNLKSYIQNSINKTLEDKKLQDVYGLDPKALEAVKSNVALVIQDIKTNEKSYTEVSFALGLISGMLIYIFIFMYGSQVMRGVIEEKTSRIVEVILSSVKPLQLMMGKIMGIAMVGLTQFLLWVILTLGIVTVFTTAYSDQITKYKTGQTVTDPGKLFNEDPNASQNPAEGLGNLGSDQGIAQVMEIFSSINYTIIIATFIFYFIGGYLLYAALFAAIGSAVDNEADTQQFMLPVTIPLILSMVIGMSFVLNNPDGSVAYWLSLIPFTSPIIMMVRIPFGVNIYSELLPSMALLILGFLGTTWLAAKIYRTGILMYGKKVTYRELWKWLTYRA
jgi:ABC-2 type transport system permease protein